MNITKFKFEILSVILYCLIVDFPNRHSQYFGPAGQRKNIFVSKFQAQPELRHHEVTDPEGGEGGQL